MNKIIAVDFDGTLCEYKFPEIGKPKYEVINKLKEEKENGASLILWICREGVFLQDAIKWCEKHGLIFKYINENTPCIKEMYKTPSRKVVATEYWDDRAYNPCNASNKLTVDYVMKCLVAEDTTVDLVIKQNESYKCIFTGTYSALPNCYKDYEVKSISDSYTDDGDISLNLYDKKE